MSALAKLHEHGLTAEAQGGRLIVAPADRLNDELRQYIRRHKAELLNELYDPLQREAMALLDRDPGLKYGIATDTGKDPVRVALAIRDVAVVTLMISADKWDPWGFMRLLEDQGEVN